MNLSNDMRLGLVGVGTTVLLAGAALASRRSGRLPGTLFTIVFENRGRRQVMGGQAPFFAQMARAGVEMTNYQPRIHPSLPGYILMTSGTTNGITDDVGHRIAGTANLAAQLDAAHIPWRAYGESMPAPCFHGDTRLFAQRHMPFLYYDYVADRPAYCTQHIVPFTAFDNDLARGTYRYVWITPNLCNDMHDCPVSSGDAWLARILPQILNSPGYRNGGAIILTFDETEGQDASIPTLLISNLARRGVQDPTLYDHRSYLATVEDLLGMPRLPSTHGVPSMASLLR